MPRYLLSYVAALLTLCAGDALWIGVLMGDFYKTQLGALMLERPRLDAAAAFYLLYGVGVVAFGVRAGLAAGSWRSAAMHSALLGLVAFGTYDLSNLATLKGWAVELTIVDMLWGAVISALAGIAGYAANRVTGRRA